jgi:uncharacterized protein (TIGR04222 family)
MNATQAILGFTFNVFNWHGPEFLVFYGVCLIVASIWCNRKRQTVMKRFEVPGGKAPTDPYEIAYLSAGAGRVAELAVVRLIAAGKVEWVKKFTGPRLVATGQPAGGSLRPAESAILSAIQQRGGKGLAAAEASLQLSTVMPAIEARLAKLGLRPTSSERSAASMAMSWPLLLIGLMGFIKLIAGITREKPVIFLIVGLVLNFILFLYAARGGGYLTPAGSGVLERLRLQHRDRRSMRVASPAEDLNGVSLGMALFGATTLASVAGMEHLHLELRRHVGSSGGDGGTGGGGCGSSGCSSGCGGGGGCGGCGGGGD